MQSSANGTTWLTRLGTVGLLTATCTIAVSASKVFYNDVGDEDDERVNKVAESDVYLKRLITSLPMIVRNPKIVSQ